LSNLTKGIILIVAVLAIGVGLVVWKKKIGGHEEMAFNKISREEIELLLSDAAKSNPVALKRLAEDPELKKTQLENLKQLLAFATQAQKEGLADDPANKTELENIRAEIIAANYDREINKDKGPMPQFGFISEEQVDQYMSDPEHENQFNAFLDSKLNMLKASNPAMANREISEDEKKQAREYFAKVQIYKKEYEDKAKAGQLDKELQDRVNLQVKLQQAQFLARLYSEKIADQAKVTDEEIAQYIAQHPDLDPSKKKDKAQEILDRARNGEDFVKLANEYSEDPGNKNPKGELQGGLYKDVKKGQMVPPFEQAALALEPGQVAPEVVESDYGYHIIKLEKKGEVKDPKDAKTPPTVTYDVRHILIGTTYKDPDNPTARPVPVKEYVKAKLEEEKEKKIVDDIVAKNNIQVPEDFTVPQITDQQIQDAMKKQQGPMQMPPPGADDEDAPPPPGKTETEKPAPKKGK
jgi:parvulin-like peptidyl-prolyl isomerase